jgi:hypothetical protein
MPPTPTQATIDGAAPYFEAVGVPASLIPSVWQALDAAGLTVVTKSAGEPVAALDTTPSARVAVLGLPGTFLLGIRIGERGWMACVEQSADDGSLERSAWTFSSGAGQFLLAPQTTGMWTVGSSAVGGTDKIT